MLELTNNVRVTYGCNTAKTDIFLLKKTKRAGISKITEVWWTGDFCTKADARLSIIRQCWV